MLFPHKAQYFRDPDRLDQYLTTNEFLPAINNEIPASVNSTFADNFSSINKLVLILFSDDKTVVPKESSWFGSYKTSDDIVSGSQEKTIIPMRLQPTYLANTFGLRSLDERGDVLLKTCEGEHMQISDDCWKPLIQDFVGGRRHWLSL